MGSIKKQCKGVKKNGTRCENIILNGSFCWIHANQGKHNRLFTLIKAYKKISGALIFFATLGSIIGGIDVVKKYNINHDDLNVGFVSYDFSDMDSSYNKVILIKSNYSEVKYRLKESIGLDNNFYQVIHIGIDHKILQQSSCYPLTFDLYNFSDVDISNINITFDVRLNNKKIVSNRLICKNNNYIWNDYRETSTLKRKIHNTSAFSKIFYEITKMPPSIYSMYHFPVNLSNLSNETPYLEYDINVGLIYDNHPIKNKTLKVIFYLVDDYDKFTSYVYKNNEKFLLFLKNNRKWYYNITSNFYFPWMPQFIYDKRFETLIMYHNNIAWLYTDKGIIEHYPADKCYKFVAYPE